MVTSKLGKPKTTAKEGPNRGYRGKQNAGNKKAGDKKAANKTTGTGES